MNEKEGTLEIEKVKFSSISQTRRNKRGHSRNCAGFSIINLKKDPQSSLAKTVTRGIGLKTNTGAPSSNIQISRGRSRDRSQSRAENHNRVSR